MKVWVDEGCTACGVCEEICPEVFEVDETASVNEDNIVDNKEAISEAAAECPVDVIIVTENDYDLMIESDEDDNGKTEREIVENEL